MLETILIIIGFLLLIKGSDYLVTGSESVAKKLRISEAIIGITLVSFGTSIPELFISIQGSISNESDLILGNIIGTNISNLLLILGVSALFKNIIFDKDNKIIDIPFMIGIVIIFYFLANINSEVSRVDGLIFITLLGTFLYYIFKTSKKTKKVSKEILPTKQVIKLILIGITLLIIGSNLVVNSATSIAEMLHIENSIIGLTLIALGTSLPEVITYVVATIKGDNEMAIGNIIGSNIMNISLVVGISAIIKPIPYNIFYNEQLIILLLSSFALLTFAYFGKKDTMTRYNGLMYIGLYIAYLVLLFN